MSWLLGPKKQSIIGGQWVYAKKACDNADVFEP